MATTYNEQPQAVFFKITSSLIKLAKYSAHGGETLCACVFHCFHDNHKQKFPQELFPITTSSLIKLANHAMHGAKTCISMTTIDKKICLGHFFPITTFSFLKLSVHHTMHRGETWYAWVIHRFQLRKIASGTFYFFTSQTSMHGSETWCACVF